MQHLVPESDCLSPVADAVQRYRAYGSHRQSSPMPADSADDGDADSGNYHQTSPKPDQQYLLASFFSPIGFSQEKAGWFKRTKIIKIIAHIANFVNKSQI